MHVRPEVHAFLERQLPGMVAVVGTNGADGFPHLVPVWYRWDRKRIHIWTLASRIWVQNTVRDPRISFSVQEDQDPYFAVMMKGQASLETGDHPEIDAEILAITSRYVPETGIEAYIRAWPGLRTILRIQPETVLYRQD